MHLIDITPGQMVRLTIDRARFDESELAYLLRTDGRNDTPTLDGEVFEVYEFYDAELPEPHTMVTLITRLPNGVVMKEYLANPDELTLVEEDEITREGRAMAQGGLI